MFFLYWKKGDNFEKRLTRIEEAKTELRMHLADSIKEVETTIGQLHIEKGKLVSLHERAA